MILYAKVPFTRLLLILLLSGLSMFTVSALSLAATPQIGDSYGGGVVLYVDGTGQHGLIAAKADLMFDVASNRVVDTNSHDNLTQKLYDNSVTDKEKFRKKTSYFVTWYFANVAANTFVGGYSDWFLPNKEQLHQIYLHRTALPGIEDTYYWSSSESGASKAWAQDFTNGEQRDGVKTNGSHVRPVRFF